MEDVFEVVGGPALRPLVRELLSLAREVEEQLRSKKGEDMSATIAAFHLQKLIDTARGAILLYDEGLPEQAQALIRVMLEVWVNFDFFASKCASDASRACRMFWDAILLQKATQMRESKYAGIPDDLRAVWDDVEAQVIRRTGSDVAKKLRKNGLSGIPFEQRAETTGHGEQYQILYRNFSRNIHGGDIADTFVTQGAEEAEQGLRHSRYVVATGILVDAVARTAEGIANNFDLPLYSKFADMKQRFVATKPKQSPNSE